MRPRRCHEHIIGDPDWVTFTEVQIRGWHKPPRLAVLRLAESCGETLVKLPYTAVNYGKPYPFPGSLFVSTSTHAMGVTIEDVGDDLRRIADEVVRIEREFGGAVKLTVVWDLGSKGVLNIYT